jgi:hypothetical protein
MGKRASMFRCRDCRETWWQWFEWLGPEDFRKLAEQSCPECESDNWELTDASEFAGGSIQVSKDGIETYYALEDTGDVGHSDLLWAEGPNEGEEVEGDH